MILAIIITNIIAIIPGKLAGREEHLQRDVYGPRQHGDSGGTEDGGHSLLYSGFVV